MWRQLVSGAAVLLGASLIISLSKDLTRLLGTRERVTRERAEISRLEEEQRSLVEQLQQVMSEAFVEREARDKLFLGRPGEVVLLFPEGEGESQEGATKDEGETEERELANWEKWARVFGFSR